MIMKLIYTCFIFILFSEKNAAYFESILVKKSSCEHNIKANVICKEGSANLFTKCSLCVSSSRCDRRQSRTSESIVASGKNVESFQGTACRIPASWEGSGLCFAD